MPTAGELFTPERLRAAQLATAEAGLDALLFTPGADLRYLTGYAAHPLERLTCLVIPADGPVTLIVPRLERPAAEASPAPGTGVTIVDHEEPYIVAGNSLILEPGMAFSIEPGIYLAGRHGARIEDIVVVTDDGVRRLNNVPTELVLL